MNIAKLQKIVKLYENALENEAAQFKGTLIEQLSNYIDLYIDKAIPSQQMPIQLFTALNP